MEAISDHVKLAAKALVSQGCSIRNVAEQLQISTATVRLIKSDDRLDPDLIALTSKQLSNSMLLAASGATDALLDQIDNGDLKEQKPIELAKIASIMSQAAGAYAQSQGAGNTLTELLGAYGIEQSGSVSKVTLQERTVTIESHKQPAQAAIEATCFEEEQAEA